MVYFFADFSACQDNFAAYEDEKYYLGLYHAVDKTGEQFRLIGAEMVMTTREAFQADGKFNIARANNVLDLEIYELGVEPKLLNDPSVFTRGELGVILGLSASNDHLARGKDQSRSFWFTNAHDNGSKALDQLAQSIDSYIDVAIDTLGLYSAFLACSAIVLRSRRQSRFTVATIFLKHDAIKPRQVS